MILQIVFFSVVVVAAAAVVFTTNPVRQVLVFAFFGLTLALLFLVEQAPDVAYSEIAVGSGALPLVLLVTLMRMRERP